MQVNSLLEEVITGFQHSSKKENTHSRMEVIRKNCLQTL
jgi:hypothetical protein